MPMRNLQLPADLMPMAEMTMDTWQYPENPEWSIQPDEEVSMIKSMRNTKRIWPIIRLAQLFSPGLRDILCGYVWEENGQMVGFANANRQGGTDTWYISAVGVRPEFRRRGIANELVEATLELIRGRGGVKVLLDMTDGNKPAFQLYEKLGFVHYSNSGRYILTPESVPLEPTIPVEYSLDLLDYTDWKTRYDLESRITPHTLQKYEPVEKTRYRRPLLARVLRPIVMAASGLDRTDFVIRHSQDGVIAWAWHELRTEEGGVNTVDILLDPAHDRLSTFLVQHLLYKTVSQGPDHKVEIIVPEWMESLTQSVENAGFKRRLGGLRMGLIL